MPNPNQKPLGGATLASKKAWHRGPAYELQVRCSEHILQVTYDIDIPVVPGQAVGGSFKEKKL